MKILQNKVFTIRLKTYDLRPILIISICLANMGFTSNTAVWNKCGYGIYESDIRTILVDQNNNDRVYVGTSKALYQSSDSGKNYKVILKPFGGQSGINDIFISKNDPLTMYVATDSGLYETENGGTTWSRIYNSSDLESNKCFSVIRYDGILYLGTQKGLFHKKIKEVNWEKRNGDLNDKPVHHIVEDDRFIYGSTGQSIYRLNKKTKRINKIYSAGIGEGLDGSDLSVDISISDEKRSIKSLKAMSGPGNVLFTGTSKGIYFSSDYGKNWEMLPTHNLAIEDLTSLLVMKNSDLGIEKCLEVDLRTALSLGCLRIMAGTNKGVFFLSNKRWVPLYKGMETNKISYLAKNMRSTVYAATTRGIYSLLGEKALPHLNVEGESVTRYGPVRKGPGTLLKFDHEPTINEVHQFAIDYAEVNYEKIANWRILARRKALMPDLSVGLDRDASDLYHWNTGANPDELQKGRELLDWDVSLSWDLADMVWSTDQTTIDSRSKLMVELREDILDEVTRLYFERRRIQVELKSDENLDNWLMIDKQMRVAELTALIDALTGGEFSQRIDKRND